VGIRLSVGLAQNFIEKSITEKEVRRYTILGEKDLLLEPKFQLEVWSYVSKSNGTPPWLTETHKKEIENFYWLSKDLECITGEKYHVDHIMPIRGENICGLHVPWNLQVLPSDINIKKSNRLLTTVTP